MKQVLVSVKVNLPGKKKLNGWCVVDARSKNVVVGPFTGKDARERCMEKELELRRDQRGIKENFQLTNEPCPRCLALAKKGHIRVETVQRLPRAPWAPLARDKSGHCCFDCASADAAMHLGMDFEMARVAVANDRQEQYRLPGAPMGLVRMGYVRPSKPGDLEDQHAWLDRHRWFDIKEGEE